MTCRKNAVTCHFRPVSNTALTPVGETPPLRGCCIKRRGRPHAGGLGVSPINPKGRVSTDFALWGNAYSPEGRRAKLEKWIRCHGFYPWGSARTL